MTDAILFVTCKDVPSLQDLTAWVKRGGEITGKKCEDGRSSAAARGTLIRGPWKVDIIRISLKKNLKASEMNTLNTIIWLPEILMIHCICYTLDSNDNFLRRQRYFEVLNVRILFESQTYQRHQDSGSSFTWNYSLLGVEENTRYKLDHLILVEAWRLQYKSSMAKIRNANDLNGCDYKQISTYRIRSRAWDSCSSTGSSSKKN